MTDVNHMTLLEELYIDKYCGVDDKGIIIILKILKSYHIVGIQKSQNFLVIKSILYNSYKMNNLISQSQSQSQCVKKLFYNMLLF